MAITYRILAKTDKYANQTVNVFAFLIAQIAMAIQNQIVLFWKFLTDKTKTLTVLNSFNGLEVSKIGYYLGLLNLLASTYNTLVGFRLSSCISWPPIGISFWGIFLFSSLSFYSSNSISSIFTAAAPCCTTASSIDYSVTTSSSGSSFFFSSSSSSSPPSIYNF